MVGGSNPLEDANFMKVNLEKLIKDIEEAFNPASIFIYGSRARDDFYEGSDYEIGVLMKKNNYVSRMEIKNKWDIKKWGGKRVPVCFLFPCDLHSYSFSL